MKGATLLILTSKHVLYILTYKALICLKKNVESQSKLLI